MNVIRTASCLALALLIAGPARARAQAAAAPPPDLVQTMRQGFGEVAAFVVRAGEMVPEAQYGHRPAAGVRTFGQLIGHIADGNNYYCGRAAGRNVEWAETVALSNAGKAELLARLRESITACTAAHTAANAARGNELLANFGHVNHHYGNIVTYLRTLGLTPPSS